jgi:hypothetical protein
VKQDIENKRGLKFALVKLTTVQVTKLPLQHKILKLDMICTAKPVLKGLVCPEKGRIFKSMLYVSYVHMTKGQAYS